MIPHPESFSARLLALLDMIPSIDALKPAILGGGTSLALVFGHRASDDIDLFMSDFFDTLELQSAFASRVPGVEILNRTRGSLCLVADSVKIDILHHPFPRLAEGDSIGELRLASLPDMAAMKVNAVTNRGSKKDFSDLMLLSRHGIPLAKALDFFCEKYGPAGRFLALRSLNWFEDAEAEPDPRYLNGWTWAEVRAQMSALAKELIQ